MLFIEHDLDGIRTVYASEDDIGHTSANNPDYWYAAGLTKPNYPVPALVLDVEWDGYSVCILDYTNELAWEYTINGVECLGLER